MIIVDDLVTYPNCKLPYKTWGHMMTDDLTPAGLNELHTMASMIGLKRSWFQDHPTMPHYDLTPSKRTLAKKAGALEMDGKEMFSRCFRGERRPIFP